MMSGAAIFSWQTQDNTLIIVPQGDISSLASASIRGELDALLERLRHETLTNVVLDFSRLQHFGSCMLAAMQAFRRAAQAKGGKVAVCHVAASAREVLEVSKFDTLWPIYRTRKEALAWVTA